MAAQVVAPSAYVRKGAEYTADIFIGATSEAIKPKVFIGSFTGAVKKDASDPNGKAFEMVESETMPLSGAREIEVAGGMGKIKETASGERKFQGVIQILLQVRKVCSVFILSNSVTKLSKWVKPWFLLQQ